MSAAATTGTSATHTERQVLSGFQTLIAMKTPLRAKIKTAPKPLVTTPEWECRTYHDPVTTGYIEGVIPAVADAQNNLGTKTMLKPSRPRMIRAFSALTWSCCPSQRTNHGPPICPASSITWLMCASRSCRLP